MDILIASFLNFTSFITCTLSFKRFQYVQGFIPNWNIFSHPKSKELITGNPRIDRVRTDF